MILIALIAACILEKSASWGPDGKLPLRAETVVSGLEVPWSFDFLPGGDVLVSERPGRVRLLQGGKLLAQPVLAGKTGGSSEGGPLGVAGGPRGGENGRAAGRGKGEVSGGAGSFKKKKEKKRG